MILVGLGEEFHSGLGKKDALAAVVSLFVFGLRGPCSPGSAAKINTIVEKKIKKNRAKKTSPSKSRKRKSKIHTTKTNESFTTVALLL